MIMRPSWAAGAVPTARGWMKGNELLKAIKFTQAQIDEWHAAQNPVKPVEALTKKELDEYALTKGVVLDRRQGKQKMVKSFLSKLSAR